MTDHPSHRPGLTLSIDDERRSDPGRRFARRARARLGFALVAAGGALLLVVCVAAFYASASQQRMSTLLDEMTDGTRAANVAEREAIAAGLVGRIVSDRIGLDAIVFEGTGHHDLLRGVGHLKGSARLGEEGNVVLAGHRDTYFSSLQNIAAGDVIHVETPRGEYAYQVDSILIVPPTRVDLLDRHAGDQLTLVTCYPFYWIGPAPKRYIVRARAIDTHAASVEG